MAFASTLPSCGTPLPTPPADGRCPYISQLSALTSPERHSLTTQAKVAPEVSSKHLLNGPMASHFVDKETEAHIGYKLLACGQRATKSHKVRSLGLRILDFTCTTSVFGIVIPYSISTYLSIL
jgi:hypothetical protein